MDIGNPLLSTAACIFVPVILLNPLYPVTLPLFYWELIRNQLIFFANSACLICEQS